MHGHARRRLQPHPQAERGATVRLAFCVVSLAVGDFLGLIALWLCGCPPRLRRLPVYVDVVCLVADAPLVVEEFSLNLGLLVAFVCIQGHGLVCVDTNALSLSVYVEYENEPYNFAKFTHKVGSNTLPCDLLTQR